MVLSKWPRPRIVATMELQKHHKVLIVGFLLAMLAMIAFIALTS